MADVVVRSTQPALAAIKLAWWRERLEELDEGKVPAEPRLEAVTHSLLPRGISGREISELEEHWASILRTDDSQLLVNGLTGRSRILFTLLAKLLGVPFDDYVANAAHSFVSVDLARRHITEISSQRLTHVRSRASRRARPITAFAALAYRDMRTGGPPFEPEATPGRARTLLLHRLTGRL